MLSAGVVALRSRAPGGALGGGVDAAWTQQRRAKKLGCDQVAVEGIVIGVPVTG